MRNSESIIRAILVVLFGYALALGTTFTGIVTPEFSGVTLGAVTLLVAVWLLVRWRRGWGWHRTPLDAVFLIWAVAFAASILANQETWRRSTIGLWYVGLYIGLWYVLNDILANRAAKRETIIDALLFGGLIVLLFGGLQIFVSFAQGSGFPRPVSTLGNPNFLGAFLVILTPLALGRLASVRQRFGRIVLAIYTAASTGLLLLTGSRGAWFGLAAGVIVWGALFLAQNDLLSLQRLRDWWKQQGSRIKTVLIAACVVLLIGVVIAGALIVRSLSEPGRNISLRTYLYDAALTLFAEKPLTGYGLFTFGHYLGRFSSIPPQPPHSHAHNAPLHIAAELGILGLVALAATLIVMFITMRRNWRTLSGRERALLSGAIAAVSGFAVHHQTDVPAMMPAIALTGMVALVLALNPAEPRPVTVPWRKIVQPLGVTALWVMLIVSGFWSLSVYSRYLAALRDNVRAENYQAADGLQPAIDADPAMSIYRAQQAYLLGMAATDNSGNLQPAITAYERVVQMEPYYTPYRANLAALYFQAGNTEQALAEMQNTIKLAPDAWQFYYGLGVIGAESSDIAAVELYNTALAAQRDAFLHPDWANWPLQEQLRDMQVQTDPSPLAQAVLALEADDPDAALNAWEQFDGLLYSTPAREVVRVMIALAQNDRETAITWLRRAHVAVTTPEQIAWQHLGRAKLAQFDGNSALVAEEFASAQVALEAGLFTEDVRSGQSFAYGQFLRQGLPRQLLPQVYYPIASPLLAYLLSKA